MSLNNNQMLPVRVRTMRQMKEVLDAEDIVLEEIEQILEDIRQRVSLLRVELINENWLEEHIIQITGGIVRVTTKEDALHVDVVISRGMLESINSEKVIQFLNKWLPAHLEYQVIYEQLLCGTTYFATVWQDDEIMIIKQVNL